MRVLDVDERQPVEAVDDLGVGPGVLLVGPAVALAAHGRADGVTRVRSAGFGRADQSKQAAHGYSHTFRVFVGLGSAQYAGRAVASTTRVEGGPLVSGLRQLG